MNSSPFAIFVAAMVCWVWGFVPPASALKAKPNFVIILTDDQGYGGLGYKMNTIQAARSGKWKLFAGKGSAQHGGGKALYDLEADIGETTDVLAQHPEVAGRLRSQVKEFEEELSQNSRLAGFVKNPKSLTKKYN